MKQHKRRKISHLTSSLRPPSRQKSDSYEDDKQWVDKYAPTQLSEVAIHARKLKDVRGMLSSMCDGTSECRILVLSGPAGASKSTLIKCLAPELIEDRGGQVIEWINPIDATISQFDDFLSSVKFRTGMKKAIILVEDLPNVFHAETRDRFRLSLMQWAYSSRKTPPLVICLTECNLNNEETMKRGYTIENDYNAETILGKKLLNSLMVARIKFNPVNATLIKRTLNNIIKHESSNFSHIPVLVLKDQLTRISQFGDIRAAVFALQFWAKGYSPDHESIPLGKESTISLFHAVGKCIHGTKTEGEDDNTTMNQVVKDFITRPGLLKMGLLENYTSVNKSIYPLENAANVIEGLSMADLIEPATESLEIATRAVRSNLSGLKSSSHAVGLIFPREWKVNGAAIKVKRDVDRYIELEFKKRNAFRSFQDSNMLFGDLEPKINKQRVFKSKSKIAYLRTICPNIAQDLNIPHMIQERLGGSFHEIYGDDELVADDDVKDGNEEYFQDLKQTEDSEDNWSEFGDDPIVDSEDGDEIDADDTFEKELIAISQRPTLKRNLTNAEILGDLSDDFDDSDF
jgi:cell cycle checkpoint protein